MWDILPAGVGYLSFSESDILIINFTGWVGIEVTL
jgi:hypothetical protein